MTDNKIQHIIRKAEHITALINYMTEQIKHVPDDIKLSGGQYSTAIGLQLNYDSVLGIRCHLPNGLVSFYLTTPAGSYSVEYDNRIRFSTGGDGYRYYYYKEFGKKEDIFHEFIDNFSEEYIFQLLTLYDEREVYSIILLSVLNIKCNSFYGEINNILSLYDTVKDLL